MDRPAATTASATDTRRRRLALLGGGLALALVAVVLLVFEPQTLFFDTTVDEDFPVVVQGATTDAMDEPDPMATAEPDDMASEELSEPSVPTPTARAQGTFVDRSHPTRGVATVFDLGDGTQVLRLEDFETDNGPDLRVYLSSAPVDADAGAFDDDAVDLGVLKGNIGNQNYDLPADVDLSRYATVVIWCDRFDVAFGASALRASGLSAG